MTALPHGGLRRSSCSTRLGAAHTTPTIRAREQAFDESRNQRTSRVFNPVKEAAMTDRAT
ncbi:hypothetical protein [Lysobacter antibioticus]|uniref:hypothetical protein n=1 Tax=Lysobacter antibioticus TaxID=84531 RepID=UPI0011DF75CE|nr:hypothetical protein [Lysobacter antibioticus]